MISTFIAERCSDLPVSACCRVMKVSTSGYYQRRGEPVTDAELAEAVAGQHGVRHLEDVSRHSYGMPRIRESCASAAARACSRDHHRPPDGHLRGGGDPLPPAWWLHPSR